MNLKAYLRADFIKKLRPLLIKNKCEVCGKTNELELHHKKPFIDMLNETLSIFNILYKSNTKDYTTTELKNIKYMMLGLQTTIPYITICNDCHIKLHKELDNNKI